VGPGGIGKTRLAAEAARRAAGHRADGVAFLPLEGVETAEALVRTVVASLALRPLGPQEDGVAALVERLRERDALLVLDNVEQLAGASAALALLVGGCPRLSVLVTTRVRLALAGETTFWLAPMEEPRSGADLERTDAGRLALDLARRVRPGWEPDARERQGLAELCALAEGSPLALELALAWLRLLEPAELVRELREDPGLLRTDSADVPARHTSIRAMLASSFRLLAAERARALGALAALRAPFPREAAQHLAGAGLRELGQLVDASMLRRSAGGRFAFHPAVREEALGRLDPDVRARHEERHASFFLERLSRTYLTDAPRSERQWLDGLRPDHEDLLAAFRWASVHRDAPRVAAHAEPFYRYLDGRNRYTELAEAWALARTHLRELPRSSERDRALGLLAALEQGAGWEVSEDEPLLELLEPCGGEDLARGLIGASIKAQVAGRFEEGRRHGERAIALATESGREWLLGFALSVCASACARLGELDEAAALLARAVGAAARRGRRGHCRPLVHLGEVQLFMGQPALACQTLAEALAACREADDRAFALLALGRLGEARQRLGDDPAPLFIEAVEEACAHHVPPFWWSPALLGLAALRAEVPSSAGVALAALGALSRVARLAPPEEARAERARERARALLGPDRAAGWERPAETLDDAALALISE
jgi:predicted ATPase